MSMESLPKQPMSRRGKKVLSEKVTPLKKKLQNIYDTDGLLYTNQQMEIKTSLTLPALPFTDSLLSVGNWFSYASCKGEGVKFFRHTCSIRCTTHPQGCDRVSVVRKCRKICMSCPVLEHCRIWSISTNLQYGFAGGMTESERLVLKESLEEQNNG